MKLRAVALCALALTLTLGKAIAAPASSTNSVKSEIIGIVQAFNAAANKGNRADYVSYCAKDAVVIDHEPPYVFRSPDACGQSFDAIGAWAKQYNIGFDHFVQKFTPPVFFDKEGDQAYVVFPVKAWITQNGKPVVETSIATFAFRRSAGTWRIESLTWGSIGFTPPLSAPAHQTAPEVFDSRSEMR